MVTDIVVVDGKEVISLVEREIHVVSTGEQGPPGADGAFLSPAETLADGTTITPASDDVTQNVHVNTQATGTLTVNAPTGSPVEAQKLILRIESTNVQTFAWDAIYRGSVDLALPTTTTGGGLTDYYAFIYNDIDTKWDFVAKTAGF